MATGGGGGGGSSGIRAGRAFVEFFAKDAGLQKALDGIKGRLGATALGFAKVGGALFAAGGSVLTPLTGAFFEATKRATDIGKLSTKLGVSAEKLSAFGYAAKTTGVTFDDLEGHFENFAERVFQGAQGTGEAADSFKRLGINVQELSQLDPVEQMIALAGAMEGVSNETERLGLLSSFGGDQFQKLNDLFRQGPDAIRKGMGDAVKVGGVMTEEQIKQAKEFNLAWLAATTAVKSIVLEVGLSFFGMAGGAKEVSAKVVDAAKAIRDFIKENKGLIILVAVGAAGLVALGAAIIGLGAVLAAVVAVLAVVFSPLGLVALAAAALVAGFVALTGAGSTLIDTLGGVIDALAVGDLSLAWTIGLKGIELEWYRLVETLTGAWNDFKSFFVDGWHDAVYLVKNLALDLGAAMRRVFVDVAAAIRNVFGDTFNDLFDTINDSPLLQTLLGLSGPAGLALTGLSAAAAKIRGRDPEEVKREINAERDRQQIDLNRQFQAEQAAREAARANDLASATADREQVQRERQALLAEAAARRAAAAGAPKPKPEPPPIEPAMAAARGAFSGFGSLEGVFGGAGKDMTRELKRANRIAAEQLDALKDVTKGIADLQLSWGA